MRGQTRKELHRTAQKEREAANRKAGRTGQTKPRQPGRPSLVAAISDTGLWLDAQGKIIDTPYWALAKNFIDRHTSQQNPPHHLEQVHKRWKKLASSL